MGPLHGVRVLEIAGLAPAPFGCMVLADLGAEVVQVRRAGGQGFGPPAGPLERGRRTLHLDLKHRDGLGALLAMAATADVFVEGFRPGVAERLGFGPEVLCARNPRLVYGRLTGWGQQGPLAGAAGHDINYIALSGALEPIGRRGEAPVPPLNLVADFAGGGMLLAVGVLAALYERERSGEGQVLDAAMADGSALLTSFLHGMRAAGTWSRERGTNLLDGGAPCYDTYATADGRYVAVGALEPRFFAVLAERLGLVGADGEVPDHLDPAHWPELRRRMAAAFKERTREEWAEEFADTDACVTPVLSPWEAAGHPHNREREAFVEVDGLTQPAPAPRFARTPARAPGPARDLGGGSEDALQEWGLPPEEVRRLRSAGVLG